MRFLVSFFLTCSFLYATTLSDFIAIDSSLRGAIIGVSIVDVDTEREIFGHNSEKNMVPASLMKLPVSFAALKKFGKKHTFETRLKYTGSLQADGKLIGDVVIEGGGDPTLRSDIVDTWVQALSKMGISSISGSVIADASCFETLMASPSWEFEDLTNYYSGVASGLSIDGNTYEVVLRGGAKSGDKATLDVVGLPIPGLVLFNEVVTDGELPDSTIYGTEYSPLHIFRGSVPRNMQYSMRGILPDPARYTGELLKRKLGLTTDVKTIRKKSSQSNRMLLHTHHSPQLFSIITDMNLVSNNSFAHHLCKHLGDGIEQEGISYIASSLETVGVSLRVADGPGLSRKNLATARAMAHLIRVMRKTDLQRSVIDELPEIGLKGSLRTLQPIPYARVLAKTGTMEGVSNLAGVIQLDTGKEYSFCFMVNNHLTSAKKARVFIRNAIEALVKELR